MTNNKPMVTVLMPVYNAERFLRQAIESILSQTFTGFEYLIIDDGSIDASRDIVRSYNDKRIRFIESEKNLGLIKTLNRGLALAKGEYIARQDADDISHPTRLEKQVTFLNSYPEIVLLGTEVNSIDQHGRRSKPYGCSTVSSALAIRWQLMFDNPFVHPSVMMRTEIVRKFGGYDEHFLDCEDYDLFSRLTYIYKTTNLKETLLDYRYHPESIDANRTKENNLLIGDILRRTYTNYMKVDPPEELIGIWLSIKNPHDFHSSINVKEFIKYIDFIYNKFISIYPNAQSDKEIKKQIAYMLIRISYNTTLKDRITSIFCFYHVFKRNIQLACRFLPKYIIMIILGPYKDLVSKKFRKYRDIKEI